MKKRFYVTTPIYYVTAKPHLGSLYSTLIADAVTRWHKLLGEDTYFVTGTDEHGQKVAQAAKDTKKDPQLFVDSFIPAYKDVWKKYAIHYDRFIRTTESDHKIGAQKLIKTLLDKGDIYKSTYEGWYCTPCETFITRKDIEHDTSVTCPSCNRQTTWVSEQTYFFKLSAYQEMLLDFYKKHPDFIVPKERFNEVISFVEGGLKDLSISRTTVPWGVPFPNDEQHTIYVWAEALCNYLTAIGYGNSLKEELFNSIWPADVQVIGKDIVRFHAVYWPAFLFAAGLQLPKRLLVHGWITVDKQKMSKSLGNVVDPVVLYEQYGSDPVRYFLLKHIPITQDGNFSIVDMEQSITSDLANNIGNLFNRMVTLASRYDALKVPALDVLSEDVQKVRDACEKMIKEYTQHMRDYMFHLALNSVLHFLHVVNAYFHEQEPWKLAKSDKIAFVSVLSVVSHSLRAVAFLLLPVMPEKMKQLLDGLGVTYTVGQDTFDSLKLEQWHNSFTLSVLSPLFIKPEHNNKGTSVMEQKKQEVQSYITIDDLIKVELRVGTVTQVIDVEKSEKLLKLTVDFGEYGERTIFAGMKKWHTPESFEGLQAVFVFNLKPRKMMGMESQGMMLAAEDSFGAPHPVCPHKSVPNGTRLK